MKEIRMKADFYRDGISSFRFRGAIEHHGIPPAVKDLYVEKAAMGSPPPRELTLILQWTDGDEKEEGDDGES